MAGEDQSLAGRTLVTGVAGDDIHVMGIRLVEHALKSAGARVVSLGEALRPYEAWITGRKGFQSLERARTPLFEAEGERVKVTPLVSWSAKDILAYIKEAGLPPHPLVAADGRSR